MPVANPLLPGSHDGGRLVLDSIPLIGHDDAAGGRMVP